MASTTRYTASVVGGGMGGKLSLDALQASGRYDLLAAADLRADVRRALAERYPGIRSTPTTAPCSPTAPTTWCACRPTRPRTAR